MSHASSRFAVAIHVLIFLAEKDGAGPVCSDHIATSVGRHPVLIRRLLGDLKQAGLVAATRGKDGGFTLGAPPTVITLGRVFEATEPGDLFPLHARPNEKCPIGACMPKLLSRLFTDCKGVVIGHLNQTTLADLTAAAACGE